MKQHHNEVDVSHNLILLQADLMFVQQWVCDIIVIVGLKTDPWQKQFVSGTAYEPPDYLHYH